MPKKWTILEDKALGRLFSEGKTDEQIAKVMPGRTATAIHLRRSKIGSVTYTKGAYKHKAREGQANIRKAATIAPGTQIALPMKFARTLKAKPESAKPLDETNCKGLAVSFTKTDLPPVEGATGSFVVFAFSDRLEFQARNLSPRQVIACLAKAIQNII